MEFLFLLMMYSEEFFNRVTIRIERILLYFLIFKFIVVMLAKNPHFNPLIIMVHVNKMAGVYL